MKINDLVGKNISPEILQQSLGLIDYQIQPGPLVSKAKEEPIQKTSNYNNKGCKE